MQSCLLLVSCQIPISKSLRAYTVATVTEPNTWKTRERYPQSVSEIDFTIDGVHRRFGEMKIDIGSPIIPKLCKGEKFVMVYDTSKPSKYIVYEDKPVFLPNEPYVETIGTVLHISPLVWNGGIEFSYLVKKEKTNAVAKDTVFTKFQEIGTTLGEKSRRRQYPHLKKGNKYVVEYLPSNSQRAVIYL